MTVVVRGGRRRLTAWPAAVVTVALITSGCGGGSDDAATSSSAGETNAAKTLAALAIIDRDTSVRPVGTGSFRGGNEGEGLGVGDTIQTSATGFAEVAYFDGSLTRVDRSGQFTLTTLDNTTGARRVEGSLVGGRAWNRVAKATGSNDQFEIDTPVATAAVRGTAFAIDCTSTDACTFTIIEGTVEITPNGGAPILVTAPARITIQRNTPPPAPTTIDNATINADPWIVKNTTRDTTTGKTPATTTTSSTTSTSTTTTTTAPPTPTGTPITTAPAATTTRPPPPPSSTPPTTGPPPPQTLAGTWRLTATDVQIAQATGCMANAPLVVTAGGFTWSPGPPICAVVGAGRSFAPTIIQLTCNTGGSMCTAGSFRATSISSDSFTASRVFSFQGNCYPTPDDVGAATLSADGNTFAFREVAVSCDGGLQTGAQITMTIMGVRTG